MSRIFFAFVFLLVLFLVDWYVFQAVRTATQNLLPTTRKVLHLIYWSVTVAAVLVLLYATFMRGTPPSSVRTYMAAFLLIVFVSKLFMVILLLFEDGTRLIRWVYQQVSGPKAAASEGQRISRSQFFSMAVLLLGALPFGAFLYGMMHGAYNYRVRKVRLKFPNLPPAFDGYRVVQISDLHAGSFRSQDPLRRAVRLINRQQPDLVVFTGDIVNNISDELEPHIDTLRQIAAPDGVLSVLGNHDYGDYVAWDNDNMKGANLERLKNMQRQGLGWNLLLNSHHLISRGQERIAFLGVENWSAKSNFPRYGKMKQAVPGTEQVPFKVLLSHDPSHWLEQVVPHYPDIDLTLSGHTHGMQFGVRIPGFQWSPVQYVYKQWAGLYREGKQHLYVNTGLGFIGYPGRVGINPEITVFELHRA